jgi:hypothetical protein
MSYIESVTLAFLEATLVDAEDRVIAKATATARVIPIAEAATAVD